jgi:hypothetical protein
LAVDPAVAKRVVSDFKKAKTWHFGGRNRLNRHKGFFVYRRVLVLGDQHPDWLTDSALSSLKTQIESDLTAVEGYLALKLGTTTSRGPYWGGADPVAPAHLDLLDMTRQKTAQSVIPRGDVFPKPHGVLGNAAHEAFNLRQNWVQAIVLRATGIHKELWNPGLQTAALDELLDHRLRMVERMKYNVTAGATIGERGGLKFSSPTAGWVDGFRLRLFEYPRIFASRASGHIPASFIADPSLDPAKARWLTFDEAGQKDWWFVEGRRLMWNEPPYDGTRFPSPLKNHWARVPGAGPTKNDDVGNYRLRMAPSAGLSASGVLDLLFPSTDLTDSWDRSWIFCDHVIAALHIEALRFAKRRREQSDATFDAILTSRGPGYISLDPMVGNSGPAENQPPDLGADQADTTFFKNGLIPADDLQVGDHLIFWNCFAYSFVSQGDWRLENTVVMDVDSDPMGGGLARDFLALQGHGTTIRLYKSYIDSIRKYFQEDLTILQKAVKKFAHDHPAATDFPWKGQAAAVIKWSPYEDFDPPGAWWVKIPSTDWPTDDEAAASIGLSVARDSTPGTGYHPPPAGRLVFFPLFQPAISGGWKAYLDKRRTQPSFKPGVPKLPRKLANVEVHGGNMPGLFHDASGSRANTVPAVTPRVAP